VNGEPQTLRSGATIQELLESLGLTGQRLAIAVNRTVVPRGRYSKQTLADSDRIEILEAVGGG
jgi:sulfur carrier protein